MVYMQSIISTKKSLFWPFPNKKTFPHFPYTAWRTSLLLSFGYDPLNWCRLTGDKFDIIVGKTIQDGYKASYDVNVGSKYESDVYTKKIVAPYCEGTTNVYVKSTTYKSLQIGALIPIKVSDRELSNNVYSQLYMGDAMNSKMGSLLTNTGPDGGTDKKMLYNTYAGSVACYQNCWNSVWCKYICRKHSNRWYSCGSDYIN